MEVASPMRIASAVRRTTSNCLLGGFVALALVAPAFAMPVTGAQADRLQGPWSLDQDLAPDGCGVSIAFTLCARSPAGTAELLQLLAADQTEPADAAEPQDAQPWRRTLSREAAAHIARLVIALPLEQRVVEAPSASVQQPESVNVDDRRAIARAGRPQPWEGEDDADPSTPERAAKDSRSPDNPAIATIQPAIDFLRENRRWVLASGVLLVVAAGYIGSRGNPRRTVSDRPPAATPAHAPLVRRRRSRSGR